MKVTVFILLILIALFALFWYDYHAGQKKKDMQVQKKEGKVVDGSLSVFTSGPELFDVMFNDIRQAKKYVHVLFYIVGKDSFSQRYIDLLKKKAEEGVEVILMLDRLGSYSFKESSIEALKASGVKFSFSRKPSFPYLFHSIQVRNHRKLTIIDGKTGYLGGFNIGMEYIDKDPKLSPWRDYHLRLQGEGVHGLELQFLDDWERASGEHIQYTQWYKDPNPKGTQKHRLFPTDGKFLEEEYIRLIKSAKKAIVIGTPYFIPTQAVLDQLGYALHDGVNLTILVPEKSDHLFVKEASYPALRYLLPLGAKVLQFQKGFFHGKYMVIDDQLAIVGTANFDKRSFFLNDEINCYVYDKLFIEQLNGLIKEDIGNSTVLTKEELSTNGLWSKLKEKIGCLLSPFL
ncbi:cardiolipin synthase [Bacillus sp. 1P06AnD]|uniref:cardiolipin synthase n=1 Tax=Bacillus sp. 1P06AnD TaxID=3132208 RepID=UPI0039A0535F